MIESSHEEVKDVVIARFEEYRSALSLVASNHPPPVSAGTTTNPSVRKRTGSNVKTCSIPHPSASTPLVWSMNDVSRSSWRANCSQVASNSASSGWTTAVGDRRRVRSLRWRPRDPGG